METSFSLLFAAVIGFGHAFEADHLIAVGNMVTQREKLSLAIRDGIYWGLGHTSTIFLIGIIIIVGRATILNHYFAYLEAVVGLMLMLLGLFRLYQHYRRHEKDTVPVNSESNHHMAYGVGLVHGLAGSGAMILLVMTEVSGSVNSIIYLLIFGIGSVLGMLVAAGLFSLPFSKKLALNRKLQMGLVVFSSLLCIVYGAYMVGVHLI